MTFSSPDAVGREHAGDLHRDPGDGERLTRLQAAPLGDPPADQGRVGPGLERGPVAGRGTASSAATAGSSFGSTPWKTTVSRLARQLFTTTLTGSTSFTPGTPRIASA